MDNFFNSKFMQSIQKGGQKLGASHFVGALQGAMMSLMGAIMIGAIFQILQSVLGPTMLKLIPVTNPWYSWLNLPYEFTMNFLGSMGYFIVDLSVCTKFTIEESNYYYFRCINYLLFNCCTCDN